MACRMFGYSGNAESDVHELFLGLKRACENDPSLSAVAEGCSRHCHGWGYVIHAENGLFHYRTSTPIYDDKVVLPRMRGRIHAIFHGRYASKPELAGHIFSHPFMAADDAKTTFFAHNGGVAVDGLPERKVDSEWALEQVAAAGGIASAIPKLKDHTRSALNLLVLTIGREKGTPALLQYFHFFKPKEPGKVAYYRMYEGMMPGGRALVSSTFTPKGESVGNLTEVRQANFDQLTDLQA